jgi:drug/metabolite transporter (DMT)-like permease
MLAAPSPGCAPADKEAYQALSRRTPVQTSMPVAQMGFVFTASLCAALFHERLDAQKYPGLAMAAAALVLFANQLTPAAPYALIFCTSASEISKLA